MSNRKQELYDRIRESSKMEVILEEMIRTGYWPADEEMPTVSAEIIRKQGELSRKIQELAKAGGRFRNEEAMLEFVRKERMAAARAKREETKAKQEAKREERAKQWAEKQQREVVYLGEEVSGGLGNAVSDTQLLQKNGLPVYSLASELAEAMSLSMGELRFLAFNRKVAKVHHYQRFQMPKKQGGTRTISAPMPRLKQAQHWILENICNPLPLHEAAHGFVNQRSIVSNARPHVGADLVINLDLKDFFPSIAYKRVKGVFRGLGYSEQVATILGLICTEPEVDEVEMDGQTWYLQTGKRALPQGSPASPAITNLICKRLDSRMTGVARKHGYVYTRYADDLTFSASGRGAYNHQKLLWQVRAVIKDEGFTMHPDKLRIMRKGDRKEVTGITVNEVLSVERKTLDRFRATLFQIEKDGPKGKTWGQTSNVLAAIDGYAHFVHMVNPQKGQPFVDRVKAIHKQYGYRKPKISKKADASSKPWWKFWG